MKTIQITLTKYRQGETCLVDENPIVNDEEYCEVVEIPSKLEYEYDGVKCHCTGNNKDTSKEELIQKIIPETIFNVWFEDNWTKNFSDFGLESPKVFSFEEDSHFNVQGIDDYVSNCKFDENYNKIISQLQQIAESEYDVEIIDMED